MLPLDEGGEARERGPRPGLVVEDELGPVEAHHGTVPVLKSDNESTLLAIQQLFTIFDFLIRFFNIFFNAGKGRWYACIRDTNER